ncbi:DUF3325 domain-containing protein [Candidatus Nitrotoga arctica]|uniref:DUF3325 domain-containing protein n=1 Tax=Candidatus Nitrotoga arctica TaxID=453162 RepID=A0ABN8AS32_9PROT|nr:DUF3325 domain-containing protein [Candidatus Nitrotoga arctica]CAG9933949.1 conserved membrane protein of unknown function [Candidatus Nitrotoga arctica]
MIEVALLCLAALGSYCGFALLALAQERHWYAVSGSTSTARIDSASLSIGGAALQALSIALVLFGQGPSFGMVLALVMLPTAAMALAFTLSWRSAWLRPLARLLRRRRRRGALAESGSQCAR